jgi:RND family efflux transporter MFP subunit
VKRANARQSDVDLALADILTAQAAVDAANAALEKTIIRAPADGTVTRIDIHVGDLVEANKPVIVVQDVSNMYIEAEVNESNVASVSIGQSVTVTYDALTGQTFNATVSSVDLSPTVNDGIVNYKLTALITDIASVKTGMTANLSIQTAYKPEVLVIPDRVITETDGAKTVEVYTDERRGKTEMRTITTGLRGDGGLIEVISGLTEGERIRFSPPQ